MSRYAYIIVEGSHDIEFIIKILSYFYGFQLIKKSENLDPYWKDLVPDTFPHKGALLQRVPVPYFLQNTNINLAIQNAGGIDKIVNTIEENFSIIEYIKIIKYWDYS
ncbi:hypothetical protein [Herpetosiphon sp. NSE202]|uniref:hypothetical protein n=1 Tax=Herpetosiphon sp. NSE202 TaxID=3351349 RepID=UPI0036432176